MNNNLLNKIQQNNIKVLYIGTSDENEDDILCYEHLNQAFMEAIRSNTSITNIAFDDDRHHDYDAIIQHGIISDEQLDYLIKGIDGNTSINFISIYNLPLKNSQIIALLDSFMNKHIIYFQWWISMHWAATDYFIKHLNNFDIFSVYINFSCQESNILINMFNALKYNTTIIRFSLVTDNIKNNCIVDVHSGCLYHSADIIIETLNTNKTLKYFDVELATDPGAIYDAAHSWQLETLNISTRFAGINDFKKLEELLEINRNLMNIKLHYKYTDGHGYHFSKTYNHMNSIVIGGGILCLPEYQLTHYKNDVVYHK